MEPNKEDKIVILFSRLTKVSISIFLIGIVLNLWDIITDDTRNLFLIPFLIVIGIPIIIWLGSLLIRSK